MSNLHWFRLYHRIIDDEKIRLLAFEDRWHFVALCCLKADGLLDEDESSVKWRKIAVKMGVQSRELDEIRRRLSEVGLVDDDMHPVAWDDLQYKSDTSTERVRKYREKTRASVKKRDGNVSVTPQDTETDTEEPKGSLSEASSDHARKPAAYPELFEAFWSEYPRTPNMSKKEAFDAWRKLPEQDRQACHTGIAGYVAFLKTKPDLETIHACRFISKRRFEGFQPTASRDNDEQWTKRLSVARYRLQWSTAEWGPSPNLPGCRVPQHLIQPGDGDGWSEWKSEAA